MSRSPAMDWWLQNTPAGRRTLERMVPRSALPPETRRQICRERGHEPLGDGSCGRCGERNPNERGAR